MLRRFLLASALLIPLPCLAQLQLFQFDGTKETSVASLYQLPSTAPGDNLETRFRIRNTGSSAVTLQKLAIAGDSFRISAAPSLPYVIAPTTFADFKVMFSPAGVGSYSANLQVNSIAIVVRGTVVDAPKLSVNGSQLSAGAVIDFGKTEFGTSLTQTLTLTNPSNASLAIGSVEVSGSGFHGPSGISAPLTLSAGQTVSFTIVFTPLAAQIYAGTLTLDQRSFNLTGLGLAPPLPTASIHLSTQTAVSGQQAKISIQLAATSKIAATGTLTMNFRANSAGPDDAAIQFMSGPKRTSTVTFSPGDSIGRFGSSPDLTFQTGTTAGDITFTLTLTNATLTQKLTIAPAMVSFDTATGTRRVNDLDVSLIGFDNTHSASQLAFTFYDTKGNMLQPGTIKADMTQSFKSYFDSGQAGGAFALRATFPVTGDATLVGGVDVEMTNSIGATKTQRIAFQ